MSVETVTDVEKPNDGTQGSSQGGGKGDKKSGDDDQDEEAQTLQLPNVKISVVLSNALHQTERKVYSVFTMIGDIGGFNGAIIILPSYILATYSARMYSSSI